MLAIIAFYKCFLKLFFIKPLAEYHEKIVIVKLLLGVTRCRSNAFLSINYILLYRHPDRRCNLTQLINLYFTLPTAFKQFFLL